MVKEMAGLSLKSEEEALYSKKKNRPRSRKADRRKKMKRIDRRGSKIGAFDQGELNKVETKMMDIPRKIEEDS